MDWIATGAGARLLEQGPELSVEVHAGTLAQLFDMAALAAAALQYLPLPRVGDDPEPAPLRAELEALGPRVPPRRLQLGGHDAGALLVHWLCELCFLLETERFVYTGSSFRELGLGLDAVLAGVRASTPAVRDLKGVTYHELVLSPVGDDWLARITFDI